ncbi:uncharacterized protein LOC119377943 [Rhipicephalus sanguineus]|uniref:Uncharacterized protein n=1 Tax=Rhipicephalus sanguineus TaxID=34632 RepID=A0A9D4SMH0_RHISA|nr:uncharacterized protein LOC119376182 [Rhipicephalus sanguineus]XP_037503150.1 uncharacterized protein LOC119377943 [Rhipicephalus sanguineus]KAH7932554.1 hypothetical protein HPB52_024351 [Rhipicephalus sanguineus]
MTTDLFKRTAANGMNPPARLRNTSSDPFRVASYCLAMFGIHVDDTSTYTVSLPVRVLNIALSVLTVLMTNLFLLEHVMSYLYGLSGWMYAKWLMAAISGALTATTVIAKASSVRQVAAFYRTNFIPWRTRAKTVARVKSTLVILLVWAFILANAFDFAANGIEEDAKIYAFFSRSPLPVNGTFTPDAIREGFLRLDAFLRWLFVLGPTCFSIFLYSFMTELAAGNMDHLKHYILTIKHSDHDDPAETVRQIRDLYFHQASSAQELDSAFSGLVLLWYLMCSVFTCANIRGAYLGEFPGDRAVFSVLLEAFPLYCVYVGITMAASDLHDATMEVLTQIEAFTAILGKRYQLQHATYFLANMCITSVGLNPPRLTVGRLFPIRRVLLAVLVLLFVAAALVSARMAQSRD